MILGRSSEVHDHDDTTAESRWVRPVTTIDTGSDWPRTGVMRGLVAGATAPVIAAAAAWVTVLLIPAEPLPEGTDMLFYEGLHGAVQHGEVDVSRYPDLLIGVVPVVNLEWIQKLHRDKGQRGYSTEAVMDTILRRMPDYINYICPQFSKTHVNFQRVPTVDTSNPFIAQDIPLADESMLVIRFANPHGIDFPYLLSMLHDSFMSRPNIIVCPGGKMGLAMQIIFTPMIMQLIDKKRRMR